jgi:hypothetical protein
MVGGEKKEEIVDFGSAQSTKINGSAQSTKQ